MTHKKNLPPPTVRVKSIPRTRIVPGERYPRHLVLMYEFMEKYIKENQYPPTNREMVDHGFAKSTSVIRFYYGRMEEYGMIQYIPGISRGIRMHPRTDWKKHENIQSPIIISMEKLNEPVR